MAYVVARPKGRFEIRESVHTPKGPRARSLANFSHFSDEVLDRARRRASRPFDTEAVRAAAARVAARPPAISLRHEQPETRHFVEASRRMARSSEQVSPTAARQEPGDALIDLLGFVAQIQTFGPARPREPLRFPPLARLRAERTEQAERAEQANAP
ncbi:MAG TPA: hypothetical protein VHX67_05195 [Acidimicrobiales bacterium]|jgi:hypothetical protein|nr:hypothetical protein [Acidimicrobiales bacterium]